MPLLCKKGLLYLRYCQVMKTRVLYYLLFTKRIFFKLFLCCEIIPICAATQQAVLLAALKHIWIEGAVAEPGTLVCSLAACPVSAQRLWGLSLSCTGLGDTFYPQLLSLTFVALPVFAPAAESRVPHCGTVREAPAEDQGPCSHHTVSETQAKPAFSASLCEGVMA